MHVSDRFVSIDGLGLGLLPEKGRSYRICFFMDHVRHSKGIARDTEIVQCHQTGGYDKHYKDRNDNALN